METWLFNCVNKGKNHENNNQSFYIIRGYVSEPT